MPSAAIPLLRAVLALACALGVAERGATQAASGVVAPVPVGLDDLGFGIERFGRRIAGVRPPGAAAFPVRFPAPESRVDAARYPNGDVALLVGGVDAPLSLWIVAADGRLRARLATDRGRRVPPAFGDGRGSWPLAVGDGLWLVCWDDDDHIAFRALAETGPVAARRLSFDVRDLEVRHDAELGLVRVRFVGVDIGPLVVPHPRRAELHAAAATLELRAPGELGEVAIANRGSEVFRGRVRFEGDGFAIRAPGEAIEIAPGASLDLVVERTAPADASAAALLHVGVGPAATTVALLAPAVAPPPAEPAPAERAATSREDPSVRPAPERAIDAPAVAAPAPAPVASRAAPPRWSPWLDVRHVAQRWVAADRLAIEGRVAAAGSLPPVIEIANLARGTSVVALVRVDGRFRAELAASAHQPLGWSIPGSPPTPLTAAAPGGFRRERDVVVMVAPRARYVLALSDPDGGALEFLAATAGPDGVGVSRVPRGAAELVLLTQDPDGAAVAVPVRARARR